MLAIGMAFEEEGSLWALIPDRGAERFRQAAKARFSWLSLTEWRQLSQTSNDKGMHRKRLYVCGALSKDGCVVLAQRGSRWLCCLGARWLFYLGSRWLKVALPSWLSRWHTAHVPRMCKLGCSTLSRSVQSYAFRHFADGEQGPLEARLELAWRECAV